MGHIIFLEVPDYVRLHFWRQDENFDWPPLHQGLVCTRERWEVGRGDPCLARFSVQVALKQCKNPSQMVVCTQRCGLNSTFVGGIRPPLLAPIWCSGTNKWGFPHLQHLGCSLLDLASCCTQPCSQRDGLQHLSVFAGWLAHYQEWCNCEFSCRQKGRSVAAFVPFL